MPVDLTHQHSRTYGNKMATAVRSNSICYFWLWTVHPVLCNSFHLFFINFQMDLSSFFTKSHCECLNESDDHTLSNAFQKGGSLFLESDCDEQVSQLIMAKGVMRGELGSREEGNCALF